MMTPTAGLIPGPFARWLCGWGCACVCAAALGTAAAHETLTNASAVLALSVQQATSNIPISITGVVTAAETNSNWGGRFFVQDASGGVFVDNRSLPQPFPGAVVQVTGVSHPGGYAPDITKPHWKQIGVAPLPTANYVDDDPSSDDSQRTLVRVPVDDVGPRLGPQLTEVMVPSAAVRVRGKRPQVTPLSSLS